MQCRSTRHRPIKLYSCTGAAHGLLSITRFSSSTESDCLPDSPCRASKKIRRFHVTYDAGYGAQEGRQQIHRPRESRPAKQNHRQVREMRRYENKGYQGSSDKPPRKLLMITRGSACFQLTVQPNTREKAVHGQNIDTFRKSIRCTTNELASAVTCSDGCTQALATHTYRRLPRDSFSTRRDPTERNFRFNDWSEAPKPASLTREQRGLTRFCRQHHQEQPRTSLKEILLFTAEDSTAWRGLGPGYHRHLVDVQQRRDEALLHEPSLRRLT